VQAASWYLRYALSYRDIKEMQEVQHVRAAREKRS
jgi:transposase-like protein